MGFQPLISIVVQCQIEKECQLYYKIMVWRRLQIEGFKISIATYVLLVLFWNFSIESEMAVLSQ